MSEKVSKFGEGLAALNAGRLSDAEGHFRDFLKSHPAHVGALNLLTVVLMRLDRFAEAEEFIARATEINSNSDVSYYNYGLILKRLNRPSEALEKFDIALQINPNVPETWSNRGTIFNSMRQYERALSDFDHALALNGGFPEAVCNKGNSLHGLNRYDDALAAFDRALRLEPRLAEAWLGRANVLWSLRRLKEALAAYDRALALKPHLDYAESQRLFSKMCACDWNNFAEESAHLAASAKKKIGGPLPFVFLAISSSCREQRQVAELWAAESLPKNKSRLWGGEIYKNDRIQIAYLSADFRQHPVSTVTIGLFEHHDKRRFKTTAISIGADDKSEMRRRIVNAFEEFHDARNLADGEIATYVRENNIDILIDLTGYTQGARTGVFAHRPAPIAVNYLGFPGTMGAKHIDYIIADRTVIVNETRECYAEKVAYLPHTYHPNDTKLLVFGDTPTRSACNLPDAAFVFGCFNNNFKITPAVFHLWMDILLSTEGSVLWLLEDNEVSSANLRQAARTYGVSEARLCFAKRAPPPEHLARHGLVDLFLDTLPYNAHTTACDALWAGVPVLTRVGETFPGRVCASLLKAMGLSELITATPEEYKRRAVKLATIPTELEAIRCKLKQNRETAPLFDTKLYTRHLESAYEEMYRRYQAGLRPDDFYVPDLTLRTDRGWKA